MSITKKSKPAKDSSTIAIVVAIAGEMPSDELRTPRRVSPTSTCEIFASNFSSLPAHLYNSTQIPACLWFFGEKEPAGKCRAVSEVELALAA